MSKYNVCFLIVSCLLLGFSSDSFGQQYFTPLKEGDYTITEESSHYNPGAKIEGSYQAYYSTRREGLIFGSDIGGKIQQDIRLRFESKINTNISLNATVGNVSSPISEQEVEYSGKDRAGHGDNTGDDGLNIEFTEAFIEYNHNPNARLKIGKHFVSVADRKGMIYQGISTAISQECRIGTWCYFVGGARIGKGGTSGLYWVQLDYPIYESVDRVKDPWAKGRQRLKNSLNIELFKVSHQGHDIPVDKMGLWTGNHSINHDSSGDGTGKSYIYFDINDIEYIGFNLRWNYYDATINFTWSSVSGKRDYFAKDVTNDRLDKQWSQRISGNAFFINTRYHFHTNWRGELTYFSASGNRSEKDGESFWEKDSQAFLEIKKGDYGDALIYFNGKRGVGEGHSISNVTYLSLLFSYRSNYEDLDIDMALYSFKRTLPVFVNPVGKEEMKSSDIGSEVDFKIMVKMEERLSFHFFASAFFPGDAYTANDNVRPVADQSGFSLLGAELAYTF